MSLFYKLSLRSSNFTGEILEQMAVTLSSTTESNESIHMKRIKYLDYVENPELADEKTVSSQGLINLNDFTFYHILPNILHM